MTALIQEPRAERAVAESSSEPIPSTGRESESGWPALRDRGNSGAWFQPVDGASLAVFRFALGIAFAWQSASALFSGSVASDYLRPAFHLTYYGFGWVRPWPGIGMHLEHVALAVAGIGFALGVGYRAAALVLLLGFGHLFLVEISLYNNHYYLLLLLAFLANLMPLANCWALDARRDPAMPAGTVPRWAVALVRFQLGVVYFFGGIAKLDSDWLHGQPMRMWLAAKSDLPVVGSAFASEWVVSLFVWGGLLIDLLAVPGLLWRRTRIPVLAVLTLFHLINSHLFDIGVFPWLMIVATMVFFPPEWPRRVLRAREARPAWRAVEHRSGTARRRLGVALVGLYVIVQLLVPLRHHLYEGNPAWTERGQMFAWRMMLRQKLTAIQFIGTDPRDRRAGPIDLRPYLNIRQVAAMSRDPDLILAFAHFLAERCRRLGIPHPEIRARALASLNGRKPQQLIDPNVDLAREQRGWRSYSWVLPLVEPLRKDAWSVPTDQWDPTRAIATVAPGAPGDGAPPAESSPTDDDTPKLVPVNVTLDHSGAGDQDDLCFWRDADHPQQSLVITSDKKSHLVAVYDLTGKLRQSLPVPKPGNIDIRQGVLCNGVRRDLIVLNQRSKGWKLVVFEVDREARRLRRIDEEDLATGPNYGMCLYHSRKTGRLYAVVTSETGKVEQYELSVAADGRPSSRLVRQWTIGKAEGAVADDERERVYISEEEKGVWELNAEPDQPAPGNLVVRLGENGLRPDLEGITLLRLGKTDGYLLLSSQGSHRFFVYRRDGAHAFVGSFAVEGAEETDGIDVIAEDFGPDYPHGIFGCHSALGRRSVLLASWQKIAEQLRIDGP